MGAGHHRFTTANVDFICRIIIHKSTDHYHNYYQCRPVPFRSQCRCRRCRWCQWCQWCQFQCQSCACAPYRFCRYRVCPDIDSSVCQSVCQSVRQSVCQCTALLSTAGSRSAPAQFAQQTQAPAQYVQPPQQSEQERYAELIMNSNMPTMDKIAILRALQPTSTTNANTSGATNAPIPPAVQTSNQNARATQGSMQGVRPSVHLTDAQIEERFRRCSTTPFKDAFKKNDGAQVTFNGSVAAHPAFMQRIQEATDASSASSVRSC